VGVGSDGGIASAKNKTQRCNCDPIDGLFQKKAHDLRKSASFQSLLLIAFIYLSLVVEGLR